MLKVYAAMWCPHCVKTMDFLKEKGIPFQYVDIEAEPPEIVKKVVDANGGDDWVIPTLEYEGKWREGKVFDPESLMEELKLMGVI